MRDADLLEARRCVAAEPGDLDARRKLADLDAREHGLPFSLVLPPSVEREGLDLIRYFDDHAEAQSVIEWRLGAGEAAHRLNAQALFLGARLVAYERGGRLEIERRLGPWQRALLEALEGRGVRRDVLEWAWEPARRRLPAVADFGCESLIIERVTPRHIDDGRGLLVYTVSLRRVVLGGERPYLVGLDERLSRILWARVAR